MLESVEWGEFRIGDLFESSNGDFDIQKSHINGKGEYVITAGITDNGILGRTDVNAKIFNKNTITIDMFGYAYFRPFQYKLVTHARVFSLKPIHTISEKQGLFMTNAFTHLPYLFGYENMCSWNKIKENKVKLPICKDGAINFSFMEKFIAELEATHLAELEATHLAELDAYLSVTGLKNYHLTAEEEKVLDDFEKGKIEWGNFNVTDIFNVKNSGNILSRDIVHNSGYTPYLCASDNNNAVSSYISYDENYIDEGNCVFIGGKTFVVTYQENDFYSNDSHNLILYVKNQEYRKRLPQLYFATCINASLQHKYSWGDSISNKKIQKDKIILPVFKLNVNYEIMDTFISAIQKLVIKDLVLFTDEKLSLTKRVIYNK